MKELYVLVVLLLNFTYSIAQTTPIPDANFEQELVDQGIDTNGINGNILDLDAQAVTNLNLSGTTTITDITGINAFINVTDLNLGNNLIADISLTALGLLVNFRTNDNSALNSIDFTQNPLLETVFMHGTFPGIPPPITQIDLSQNLNLVSFEGDFLDNVNDIIFPTTPTLVDIDVRYLSDETFDLSLLSGLENLRIGGWRSNVDITLPSVYTNLKNLRISSIDIPTIDISDYVNLEDLYLWGTYVENLILPASTTLTDIFIILHDIQNPLDFSIMPNLETIDITSNQTTPLIVDVTQNYALVDLDLSNNDMNSIDVTQNAILEELRINNNNLTTLDVTQNLVLYRLSASNNQLPTIDVTQNLDLQYLTLSSNLLPDLDITQNIELRGLDISDNLFTGTGLDLTQNSNLSSLRASLNQIESLDITQNVVLSTLVIDHNLFTGTSILDQFYTIRTNAGGIFGGALVVSHNQLSGIMPDYASLIAPQIGVQPIGFDFAFDHNYFEFGHFENQHADYVVYDNTQGPPPSWTWLDNIEDYFYAPQAKVDIIETINANAGDDITLTTVCSGAQNHYRWFKDGVLIPDAPDAPTYTIPSVDSCDGGVYHSEITSDLVPFENTNPPGTGGKNLLLIRNDITVNINSPAETCTSLTSPLDGSVDVALNEVLTWTDNLGACGYYISIGTSPGGTDIVNNEQIIDSNNYVPSTNYPPGTLLYVTITPYFFSGVSLVCNEETFTTGTDVNPLICTSLISPANGAVNVPVDSDLEWNVSAGATNYVLSIGTSSGATDILPPTDIGNTMYNPVTDFPQNTELFVTIIPEDSFGSAIGCIEESFTTAVLTPSCTTIVSPSNGTTDVSITSSISWVPVGNADGYIISLGTTAGGIDILDSFDVGNVTTYTPSPELPANEDIFVTITPYNSFGNTLGCASESFTTEILNPNCTSLSSPLDGDINVPLNATLSWVADSYADGYLISIGTSPGGIDIVDNEDIGNTTTYTPLANFIENTEIFVTIIPYNAFGHASGCVEESFTTEILPAGCSNMTAPVFNAVNVPVDTNISWSPSTNTAYYTVALGTSIGSEDIVPTTNVGDTTTFNPPVDLPPNTDIYVTITSVNAFGLGTTCGSDMFTTTNVPPECTNLVSPLNGAMDVSISTAIEWLGVTNTDGYIISIGTTPSGSDLVDAEDVGNTTLYNYTGDLPQGTEVFIRIVPYNNMGQALSCVEERFTTELLIPNCTSLTSPSDGQIDVSVDTDLSWTQIPYVDGYILSVGTSLGGTDIVNNLDVNNTTAYTFDEDLPEDSEIFVTVIPYNAAGSPLFCVASQFRTEIVIPECTYLLQPYNGETEIAVDATIYWADIDNANGYRLTIGTTPNGNEILDNFDVGNVNSYSPNDQFIDGSTIYLTITPYNSVGDALSCDSESFVIEDRAVVVPRFFTPNNDSHNDLWQVFDPKNEVKTICIFDRYGKLLVMLQGASEFWDGRFNGKELPTNDYWYHIELANGKTLTGNFTLKR